MVQYNTPTVEQYSSVQQAFDYFNNQLFDNTLSSCMLTFKRKAKSEAYFIKNGWSNGGVQCHEISINPDLLSNKDNKFILSCLVRQMVTQWQNEYGTPTRISYYDKEWAAKMELVGLRPTSDGTWLGKKTGQSLKHLIVPNGEFENAFVVMPEPILMAWQAIKIKSNKTLKTKYICSVCGDICWGKKEMNIKCMDCDSQLIETSTNDKNMLLQMQV